MPQHGCIVTARRSKIVAMSYPKNREQEDAEDGFFTRQQLRHADRKVVEAELERFRSRTLSEEEVYAALSGTDVPEWVSELIYLTDIAQDLTLYDLADIVGVNRKQVMAWRRRHPPLETACRDYLAATFEDEMENPSRNIRPGIIAMAVERIIPTFSKNEDGMISEEDAAMLVRAILDSLKTRLADTGLDEAVQNTVHRGIATDIRHEFAKRSAT